MYTLLFTILHIRTALVLVLRSPFPISHFSFPISHFPFPVPTFRGGKACDLVTYMTSGRREGGGAQCNSQTQRAVLTLSFERYSHEFLDKILQNEIFLRSVVNVFGGLNVFWSMHMLFLRNVNASVWWFWTFFEAWIAFQSWNVLWHSVVNVFGGLNVNVLGLCLVGWCMHLINWILLWWFITFAPESSR